MDSYSHKYQRERCEDSFDSDERWSFRVRIREIRYHSWRRLTCGKVRKAYWINGSCHCENFDTLSYAARGPYVVVAANEGSLARFEKHGPHSSRVWGHALPRERHESIL